MQCFDIFSKFCFPTCPSIKSGKVAWSYKDITGSWPVVICEEGGRREIKEEGGGSRLFQIG